jgi:NMD protein affecting ribosome stability and mRNA decay
MAKCDRCGKEEEHLADYLGEKLCRICWKKQDLYDQRDWEDDPENESEG